MKRGKPAANKHRSSITTEDAQRLCFEFLRSDAYLSINKKLIRLYGLEAAVLLADLISKHKYFADREMDEDGWFFSTVKSRELDTGLSPYRQRKAIQHLGRIGLLKTDRRGVPAKQYFRINYTILNNKILKIKELEVKNLITINKNKNKNKNNISLHNKKSKNSPYIPIAQRLSKIIQMTKRIKHTPKQIERWADEIRKLVEHQGVGVTRIRRALNWYSKHSGEPYVPIVESGGSLRSKFIRLEAAMERERGESGRSGKVTAAHLELTKIVTQAFPELNNTRDESTLAKHLDRLDRWIEKCRERWARPPKGKWPHKHQWNHSNIPSTQALLHNMVKWLEGEKWIDSITTGLFDFDGVLMKRFLKRVQEDACFDFETGREL